MIGRVSTLPAPDPGDRPVAARIQELDARVGRARFVEVYRRLGGGLQRVATLTGNDALASPLLPGFTCPNASLWVQPAG